MIGNGSRIQGQAQQWEPRPCLQRQRYDSNKEALKSITLVCELLQHSSSQKTPLKIAHMTSLKCTHTYNAEAMGHTPGNTITTDRKFESPVVQHKRLISTEPVTTKPYAPLPRNGAHYDLSN